MVQDHHVVNKSHMYFHMHFLFFSLARWLAIGFVIVLWPIGIRWLSQYRQRSGEFTQILLSRRWHLLGFFVAMEGLIFFKSFLRKLC